MTNRIRLGHIAGIEIVADWSLLIIFLLITFSLTVGVFPSWHPDWGPALLRATVAPFLRPPPNPQAGPTRRLSLQAQSRLPNLSI